VFIVLLIGSLALSLLVSFFLVRVFRQSVSSILGRIIKEDISLAWVRYIMFAMYVAGISSGVRVWDLERYIQGSVEKGGVQLVLNADRVILECYQTLIGTMQGISGVLLAFFAVAIIAYAVIRAFESKKEKADAGTHAV
jgi:hypothetical protein